MLKIKGNFLGPVKQRQLASVSDACDVIFDQIGDYWPEKSLEEIG